MKENGTATIPEAPVSWTARYTSPEGFDCMLTLRGTEVKAVMGQAKAAVEAMVKAGCKPQASRPPASASSNGNGNGEGRAEDTPPICAIHHTPMQKRQSKSGGYFWSCNQKLEDGSWCPYKPPKQ